MNILSVVCGGLAGCFLSTLSLSLYRTLSCLDKAGQTVTLLDGDENEEGKNAHGRLVYEHRSRNHFTPDKTPLTSGLCLHWKTGVQMAAVGTKVLISSDGNTTCWCTRSSRAFAEVKDVIA